MTTKAIHAQSLRMMLAAERNALREMRDTVADAVAQAIRIFAFTDGRKSAAVDVVRGAASSIATQLPPAIVDGREQAAWVARHRFDVEMESADIDDLDEEPEDDAVDELAAEAAASSYSAAWAASAMALVIGSKKGTPDLAKVTKLQDYRLSRIAGTEIPRAYARQTAKLDELLIRRGDDLSHVMRRWDATLDARTCRVCRDHDGEEVPIGAAFRDDDVPGLVHPLCRCIPTLIVVAQRKVA